MDLKYNFIVSKRNTEPAPKFSISTLEFQTYEAFQIYKFEINFVLSHTFSILFQTTGSLFPHSVVNIFTKSRQTLRYSLEVEEISKLYVRTSE